MEVIYQSVFFIAIALLAITVAVFVLAVSLLGRAVRLSVREQMIAEQRRKEDTENEIKKIQAKLEQAKSAKKVEVEDLVKSLRELEVKDRKHRNRLRWIKIKPKLLTANWGALVPGALFLSSALFSGYALYYKDSEPVADTYAFFSIITLFAGILIVGLALKVIEGVAVTSEETSFLREKEMFKASLKEIEEEKKPVLILNFSGTQPPFRMKAGSEMGIEFDIGVTAGNIGRDITIFIYAPPSFKFPKHVRGLPPKGYEKIAEYVCALVDMGNILRGIYKKGRLTLRAPSQPANYTLYYGYLCEGYHSALKNFGVAVE
ncbi:hypothetical protein ACFLW4_05060 [Chloroflexota bacterium]